MYSFKKITLFVFCLSTYSLNLVSAPIQQINPDTSTKDFKKLIKVITKIGSNF